MSVLSQQPHTLPPIVRFYHPSILAKIQDRTFRILFLCTLDDIEKDHDYSRIIFPTPEGSPLHPSIPTIDRNTFNCFRNDPLLRHWLRRAFRTMLDFFGLTVTATAVDTRPLDPQLWTIKKTYSIVKIEKEFTNRAHLWVCFDSPHHSRITRMIRSLRILGCQAEAEAFYRAVRRIAKKGNVNPGNVEYWTRAARRELHVPPGRASDVFGGGRPWLRNLDDVVGDKLGEKVIYWKWGPVGAMYEGEASFEED